MADQFLRLIVKPTAVMNQRRIRTTLPASSQIVTYLLP